MQSEDREVEGSEMDGENAGFDSAGFDSAATAVREAPGDDAAWDRLEDFAASSQKHDQVSNLYREALSGELAAEIAPALAQRAVQFHEEWFREDSPVLVAVLSRVLEVDPTAGEWAFQRLTVVHTVAERWDELLALYDREIARTPDTHRRAALLEEAAQTAKDFAGAPDRAATYLIQLFELRPRDRALASSLERLLERQERYADLVRLWRTQSEIAPAAEAYGLRLRIAEALFDRLDAPGDAIEELRALLESDVGDPDGPMEMLERVVRDERVDQDARRDALGILRERYDALNRTSDVIGTLDTAIRLASHEERVILHRDAAQRLVATGEFDAAMEHLASLLKAAPGDEEALQSLREVAPKTSTPRRLVEVLVAAADASSDPDLRAPLRLEAVDRLVAHEDLEAAIEQLRLVASEEQTDGETARVATRRLAELLGRASLPEERLTALERLAELEKTRGEKRDALVAAARLAAELGFADRALQAWEATLVADPKDPWALEEIVNLLEREGRNEELVGILRRRAESGVPPLQRRSDLTRIARVQSEELGQTSDAIATWNEIGASHGEDGEVVDALVALYARAERWEERAEVLERAATREDAHLAALRATQGETFASHLGRPADALRAYRRALEADVRHEAARAGLSALADHPEVGGEAVEALAASRRATDEWESLLDLLEPRLAHAEDAQRVVLLREAARLQEGHGAAREALSSLRRAFAFAPEDLGLESEILRLAEATGDWEVAAEAIGAGAEASDDDARAGHLRALEASIREEPLGDLEGALEAATTALGHRPSRVDDATRVARLTEGAIQRGEPLEDSEDALVSAANQPNTPTEILEQLARVQRAQRSPELFGTLQRIAERRIDDLDALREAADVAPPEQRRAALRALYERAARLWRSGQDASGSREASTEAIAAAEALSEHLREEPTTAVELMAGVSRLPLEPDDARAWLRRAARTAHAAGDSARASELFRDLLQEAGDDAEALEVLGDLYAAQERNAELLGLRRRELTVVTDADRRVALRLEIARLVTDVEARGGRIEALTANLEERPGHEESLDALESLLRQRRDHEGLADVLEAQGELVEGERAANLWARVATLAEESLGDPARALEAHRKVVEVLPDDITALDALARIQRERGESAAASRWLERRLSVASDDERADVTMALASALLDAGRVERACEVLEQVREHAPDRQDIRTLLAEQYRAQDAHEPLARVLADSAARTEDPDQVLALVREAAAIYRERLGRPAEAIPVLRKARELAPDDRNIELMLAEGLRDAGEFDEARSILEKVVEDFGRRRSSDRAQVHYELGIIARAQGDLSLALEQLELASKMAMAEPRMLQMLGTLAREAGDFDRAEKAYRALLMTVRRRGQDDEGDVGSAEVLYELHALARSRGDDEQAQELRDSALEAAAQSDAEAFRFRDVLTPRDEHELALAGLDRRVEVASESASKAAVLAAMGDVLETIGRREEAVWRRLQALDHAPGKAAIHDATLAAVRAQGEVRPYAEKLEEIVERRRRDEDSGLLAGLLVRLGRVHEEDLGDFDKATSLYGRAESLLDEPVAAWVALARVGEARDDVPLQRRVLTKLVEVPELAENTRANALHQLARLQLRDPSGLDEGAATARRAFDAAPRHAPLSEALDAATARHADHAEAMRLYEEVARDAGDDAILLRFLERRASRADATLPQVREGVERARALEEEERLDALLVRAAEVAAASEEGPAAARAIFTELAARRSEAGDLPAALKYAKRGVDTAQDDEERRVLERDLAAFAAQPGGDLDLAAEIYERHLEMDPMDEGVWRPLLEVTRRRDDEDRLADLVAFLVDGLLDPGLRNAARMERVRWLMGAEGREFDAVDTLKAVLDEEPDHQEAAGMLAQLYERSGYDEDLVELLERQLDVARDHQDTEQISELSLKLGQLFGKVRRDDAMDVYRRALDWVPLDRPIIEEYLALMGPEDDATERARVREKLLGVETGERASILSRELYEEWASLEEPEGMLRALALGYRGNPNDEGIREQLEAYYREHERFEELATFLADDAERLVDDPAAAVERLKEAASLRRDRLSDAEGAVDILRRAHDASPGVEILGELVLALQSAGRTADAEEEIGRAIEAHEGRDRTYVQLLVSRSGVRLAQNDTDGALADLEEGYAIAPDLAVAELVQVLVARRDHGASTGDNEAERAAVLRLTDVLQAAGDPDQARDVMADWVERTPTDAEALERLRDIEMQRGDWHGVIQACHRLVQVVTGEAQIEAGLLLARAAEEAEVPGHARSGLEYVHQEQPDDGRITDRLRALYEATGARAELATLSLEEAAGLDDAQRAFELERDAGRLFVELGQGEAAMAALGRARERQPDDHDTTVLLADAYMAAGYFAEAGQMLEDAIGRHTRRRSPELSQLQHRMATLAAGAGDVGLQIQWLNAALESDKNNGFVAAELAHLAWAQGDLDVALAALRAVTLSREDGPMSRAAAFLMQARIAHQRGEARRALLWARKARSEDPELEGVADFLAELGDS